MTGPWASPETGPGKEPRFLFESELDAMQNGRDHSLIEAEVKVQTKYLGGLEIGHFRFNLWDFDKLDGPQLLCWRGASLWFGPDDLPEGNRNGFYHGGTPLDEFAALFTLHFNSLFEVGQVVRTDDQPCRMNFTKANPKKETPGRNLAEAKGTVEQAVRLRPELKLPFMLALRFHSLALRQWSTEPDMAFISFVSAIEAVACTYGQEAEIKLDVQLESLLADVEGAEVQRKLRKLLWERGAVKRKVVAFIVDHTTHDFWNDPARPIEEFARVKPEDLEKIAKTIYNARSTFLHSGEPPAPVFKKSFTGGELDFSHGLQIGERKWQRSEFLPHLSFIARLVQHNLVTYLARNQVENKDGAC